MRLAITEAVFAAHSFVVDKAEVSHTGDAILAVLHTQAMKSDILDDPQLPVANITQHIAALDIMREDFVPLRQICLSRHTLKAAVNVAQSHVFGHGLDRPH